ncbi:hypothetical protein FsymDg_0281 [Candidatus Protofrankia datiscae]|uniref:Uncharacterized protein n=1 Tax=Candidatus Protofrankia datiscae TaxID=2716812 RepID=F8B3L6_9ACTN|nr:hypothetical protein FsymDg_0281 [Candidatus Protofrankia datiscae]
MAPGFSGADRNVWPPGRSPVIRCAARARPCRGQTDAGEFPFGGRASGPVRWFFRFGPPSHGRSGIPEPTSHTGPATRRIPGTSQASRIRTGRIHIRRIPVTEHASPRYGRTIRPGAVREEPGARGHRGSRAAPAVEAALAGGPGPVGDERAGGAERGPARVTTGRTSGRAAAAPAAACRVSGGPLPGAPECRRAGKAPRGRGSPRPASAGPWPGRLSSWSSGYSLPGWPGISPYLPRCFVGWPSNRPEVVRGRQVRSV